MAMKFPDGFLWGTATAAHQVEGGNFNSDYWLTEHLPVTPFVEPSGDSCDQYHRYREDCALLARLGFNSYRFSIEWARVEPEPGEFSAAAIEHYRRVIGACQDHGLAPVVTLHHFSSPRWFAARGGFETAETGELFARYCERIAHDLGDLFAMACTINELNSVVHLQHSGVLPPDEYILQLPWRVEAARRNSTTPERFSMFPFAARGVTGDFILQAHRLGAAALRSGRGRFPIGMTVAMQEIEAVPGGEENAARASRESEDHFLEAARGDDFVGVQTYSRRRYGEGGPLPPAPGAKLTQMGYEDRPEALEATIRHAHAVARVPIVVTESGIATEDEARRIAFVREALRGAARCIKDGIDVRGYYYWSAFDNFEWLAGYAPKFGIIAVDRTTQVRTVKPAGQWLGRVARANSTEIGD
ncbi:MAG: glycoside hydrolase family 1 protein [Candidatus Binataceae bacterium]